MPDLISCNKVQFLVKQLVRIKETLSTSPYVYTYYVYLSREFYFRSFYSDVTEFTNDISRCCLYSRFHWLISHSEVIEFKGFIQ